MNETTFFILMYMLLATCFGFMIGWTCGEQVTRRHNAEEKVEELREQLQHAYSTVPARERQLKELRSVLNDVRKQILAVSKALKNPAR
jgi:Tfp pilus assembly protein PilO